MTTSTAFTSAFDRLAAGVMVTSAALILTSSFAIFVLGAEVAGGAMGLVGAAMMAAVATAITRPLQARMPRAAAALTALFAYGFVVGGVAFNLETILVAHDMAALDTLSAFPVLGMSGVLGPLSLVAIGLAMLVSGAARVAGAALALCGMFFPVSRIFDIAPVAMGVDSLLLIGMTTLAWQLVRTPARTSAARPAQQLVAA